METDSFFIVRHISCRRRLRLDVLPVSGHTTQMTNRSNTEEDQMDEGKFLQCNPTSNFSFIFSNRALRRRGPHEGYHRQRALKQLHGPAMSKLSHRI